LFAPAPTDLPARLRRNESHLSQREIGHALTRREVHALLGAGAGSALLSACATSTQGSASFAAGVAHLSFAQFPALQTAGGSAVVDVPGYFPLVVVRTSASDAVALSATCTHAFCIMSFTADRIHCPCHDANFALDGHVLSGPTSIPIPIYTAAIAADGINVQIES
jgi:cytochrome b6-f complex iron-sulfur subunit